MTDRPRPPRRDGPPPLPPRPLVPEPFPPAKSEPPPLPVPEGWPPGGLLDTTPAPDARRMRSTPPSGSSLLAREVEGMSEDPRDETIRELRHVNIILREKLVAMDVVRSPVPDAPRSRAHVAGKASLNLGKYTTLAVGVLGLLDVAVGLWFPEYVGPLGMLKRALGVP